MKISEIAQTLARLGITSVDEQAETLGIARSTAWTILRANHKSSGLSATTVARMWTSDRLPAAARTRIKEYVEERSIGLYGHGKSQQRRFVATLNARLAERGDYGNLAPLQPHAESEDASQGWIAEPIGSTLKVTE